MRAVRVVPGLVRRRTRPRSDTVMRSVSLGGSPVQERYAPDSCLDSDWVDSPHLRPFRRWSARTPRSTDDDNFFDHAGLVGHTRAALWMSCADSRSYDADPLRLPEGRRAWVDGVPVTPRQRPRPKLSLHSPGRSRRHVRCGRVSPWCRLWGRRGLWRPRRPWRRRKPLEPRPLVPWSRRRSRDCAGHRIVVIHGVGTGQPYTPTHRRARPQGTPLGHAG